MRHIAACLVLMLGITLCSDTAGMAVPSRALDTEKMPRFSGGTEASSRPGDSLKGGIFILGVFLTVASKPFLEAENNAYIRDVGEALLVGGLAVMLASHEIAKDIEKWQNGHS